MFTLFPSSVRLSGRLGLGSGAWALDSDFSDYVIFIIYIYLILISLLCKKTISKEWVKETELDFFLKIEINKKRSGRNIGKKNLFNSPM